MRARSTWLDLAVGNMRVMPDMPDGPHYAVDIAITSPYFIALNDGKEPDCSLFANPSFRLDFTLAA